MCRLKFRPAAMCRFKLRPCENKVLTSALHNGREQMLLPFKQSTAMCRPKLRPAAMCRPKLRPCENKVLTLALHNGREQMIIIFITLYSVSACRKSLFLKQTSNLLSLSPCPLSPGKGDFTGATAPSPCRGLRPCDPFFINERGFSTVCNAVQRFIHLPAFFRSLS